LKEQNGDLLLRRQQSFIEHDDPDDFGVALRTSMEG